MRIGLIGCGRVGVTIFYLLRRHNTIVGVYDTDRQKERKAVKMLGIRNNPDYREMISQCDALFIATPDDSILKAYKSMSGYLKETKLVFHFSGILSAKILPKKRNVFRASIHPFATFPKIVIPPTRKHLFISVEGDRQAVKGAHDIFHPKYFTLKRLKKEDKVLYHLIGVFSSNLLLGLIASIHDIAERIDWKEKDIHQLVYPIIEETLHNIKKHGLDESLSGPLQRCDVETVKKHLKTLKQHKQLLRIYKELSLYIVQSLTPGNRKSRLRKLLSE